MSILFPTRSLASKLAVLYAFTTFTILLVASAALYWSVVEHLQNEHQGLLKAKIVELREYFSSSLVFNEELRHLIDVEHHHSEMPHSSAIHPGAPHHVYVRIVNQQGELILQSERMPSLPEGINFPQINAQHPEQVMTNKMLAGNQFFLLGTAAVHTRLKADEEQLFIQAVLELQADETLLTDYRKNLFVVLIVGVLLSALTGYWVTRRGLQPLLAITSSIHNINVDKLHQRVLTEKLPTEIAVLGTAFNEMLVRLDDSFERLSGFSSDLAHELRTPVNNIMGEAEVALSKQRTVDEYTQVLVSNMEECARLARMIDALLFLAKAENPQTKIQREQLVLSQVFQVLQEYYQHLAEEKEIEMTCDAEQLTIYADPGLLRRALGNILDNALRHSHKHEQISMKARLEDGFVVVSIKDQGEGIVEEQLPFIFERFFRADKSRQRQTQGSGLGLAIVKSIMLLHQGEIKISSQDNAGVLVELFFPQKECTKNS